MAFTCTRYTGSTFSWPSFIYHLASGLVRSTYAEKPGEGILKTAKDLNADMIVMGSLGMGTVRRTILGSVSDYVLHHSPVPVIICPPE
ncbi:universal stress protein Sll1388-like [Crassostrea virginica]